MRKMLSIVDLVVECRDYRIPASSINPLFEEALGEKRRMLVYTKADLAETDAGKKKVGRQLQFLFFQTQWQTLTEGALSSQRWQHIADTVKSWSPNTPSFFLSHSLRQRSFHPLIEALNNVPSSPRGNRVLVIGMPNVGKSSLINLLRSHSINRGKVARTGSQPGITRKISGAVKISPGATGDGVYVYDTPGVFMPYMPDPETMLNLALCQCIKESLIPSITLADYLLYKINRTLSPNVYAKFSPATNDVSELLPTFAIAIGCIGKGGVPDIDTAAKRFVDYWRDKRFGGLMLDDVESISQHQNKTMVDRFGGSMAEAKKKRALSLKEAKLRSRAS